MKKYFIVVLLGLVLLFSGIFAALYFSADRKPGDTNQITHLPWQISLHADGTSSVFGIQLDHSTLAEVDKRIAREVQVHLFRDQDNSLTAEALFERINLGGLISNLILTLDVDEKTLRDLELRAIKRSPMPTGSYELSLSINDQEILLSKRILAITYSPVSVQLNEEMIFSHFGKTDDRFTDSDNLISYFYPDRGVAITLNTNKREKEVFQYVAPRNFDHLRQTLYGAVAN